VRAPRAGTRTRFVVDFDKPTRQTRGRYLGPLTRAAAATPRAEASADQDTRQAVVELLDRVPLMFVPERASGDGATVYAVRGRQASIWLSDHGLSYRIHPAREVEAQAADGSWVVALDLVRGHASAAGWRGAPPHQGELLQWGEGPVANRSAALWLGGLSRAVARVSSPNLLFTDGFESGDTLAWPVTVP
jgi:hypothetical protein